MRAGDDEHVPGSERITRERDDGGRALLEDVERSGAAVEELAHQATYARALGDDARDRLGAGEPRRGERASDAHLPPMGTHWLPRWMQGRWAPGAAVAPSKAYGNAAFGARTIGGPRGTSRARFRATASTASGSGR